MSWQKNQLIASLIKRGFDKKIVAAFRRVRREDFVPAESQESAYEDMPLRIGFGQTISQPYTIAFMLSLLELEPGQKIMEVGSGSGYVLALLSQLAPGGEIYGAERAWELTARSRLALNNYKNIKIFQAGKSLGLPELAPFERILVSAAAAEIPAELTGQLSAQGILVCPVKNDIVKIKKTNGGFFETVHHGFRFVPLIK